MSWPLRAVLSLFALVAVNSVYLLVAPEDAFHLIVFLTHLVVGAALAVPLLVLVAANLRAAPTLAVATTFLVASGVTLLWFDPAPLHVLHAAAFPLVAALLVLRYRVGFRAAALYLGTGLVGLLALLPLRAVHLPGEAGFEPSLAKTASGGLVSAAVLMNDLYCQDCHPDIHRRWSLSAHRLSSFNNPAYLFSVRETRDSTPDGAVPRSRFCAGCHDPVPLLSGEFSRPDFDELRHPSATAGVTCTVCHGIVSADSVRGNADYTLRAPRHYPFAFSRHPILRWINRRMVETRPGFHRKTFLGPLHRSPEFCSTCHKVVVPEAVNGHGPIASQNHFDSFLAAGRGTRCTHCHMPPIESDDVAAEPLDGTGRAQVHDHLFPGANTALPLLAGARRAGEAVRAHRTFLTGSLRVDLFGIRDAAAAPAEPSALLRPGKPALIPGRTYLLDVVVRALTPGHHFTQGTADSNEVWLQVHASSGQRRIGTSGDVAADGQVDPGAYFLNAFVIDRNGYRIDRRNLQDRFAELYDHQLPPDGAVTVPYRLSVPRDLIDPVVLDVAVHYRKFDATYVQHVFGAESVNRLPVTVIARDRVVLPVAGSVIAAPESTSPASQAGRWSDYRAGVQARDRIPAEADGDRARALEAARRRYRDAARASQPGAIYPLKAPTI